MDEKTERPGVFNLWPSITYINCPNCGTHWHEPRFGSEDAVFPPIQSDDDKRQSISRVHCPRCGNLLSPIEELSSKAYCVGRSPILNKPFIGTISGIRDFIERCRGADTQLWQYTASISNLVLKIDSLTDNTHAFVVCSGTTALVLPKLYWKSSLALSSTDDRSCWTLRDEAEEAEVSCARVGIFHQLTNLW